MKYPQAIKIYFLSTVNKILYYNVLLLKIILTILLSISFNVFAEQIIHTKYATFKVYDDLGGIFFSASTLHLGRNAQMMPREIFATVGTETAAVELFISKNVSINGIFISANINSTITRSGVSCYKSALLLQAQANIAEIILTSNLVISKKTTICGSLTQDSTNTAILINIPLTADIINYGNIIANHAISFQPNGYLSGDIINYGNIISETVINTKHNINKKQFNLLNDKKATILGNIIINEKTVSVVNKGVIGYATKSFDLISQANYSSINNSGTMMLKNITSNSPLNNIHLSNSGVLLVSGTAILGTLNNNSKVVAGSVAILSQATNSSVIMVNNLYLSGQIVNASNSYNITNAKMTNLARSIIRVNSKKFQISNKNFDNQGLLDITGDLELIGDFSNTGMIKANNFSGNAYDFINAKKSMAMFNNLGNKSVSTSIINNGSLIIGQVGKNSYLDGDIIVHKDNTKKGDGDLYIKGDIIKEHGSLILGKLQTLATSDLLFSVRQNCEVFFNEPLVNKNLVITNEASLQLLSGSKIKNYYSSAKYVSDLAIKLQNYFNDISATPTLLELYDGFSIAFNSHVIIKPPERITHNSYKKRVNILEGSSTLELTDLYIHSFKDYIIADNDENNRINIIMDNIHYDDNNSKIVADLNIISLIGYYTNTEYAKQVLTTNKQLFYGIACIENKHNKQYSSNNLIISPVYFAENNLLNFTKNNKVIEVGSKSATFMHKIIANDQRPNMVLGTTVAKDKNFININSTQTLELDAIYLYNLNVNARDHGSNNDDNNDNNAMLLNGVHPLILTDALGLQISSSVSLVAGSSGCGLSIVAPISATIVNSGIIGDKKTGTAIAIANDITGNLINSGSLQAVNYALYIAPNIHSTKPILDINIKNEATGIIDGNIYLNATNTLLKLVNKIENHNIIRADKISITDSGKLHLVNKSSGIIAVTELSITELTNYGRITINKIRTLSNKYIKLTNYSFMNIIDDLSLEHTLTNDGIMQLNFLDGRQQKIINNNEVNVNTLKNINIENKGYFKLNKAIVGNVTIDTTLQINDIVNLTHSSKLTASNIVFNNNSRLINNNTARIAVVGLNIQAINNDNFINRGLFTVVNKLQIDGDLINEGTIITDTIIANKGCLINKATAKLLCNNIGDKGSYLSIIDNIQLNANVVNNITGNIKIHLDNNRYNDGKIQAWGSIKQLSGNFYLGGIENNGKLTSFFIDKNSFSCFKLADTHNNISFINHGSLELPQGSVIQNYNSQAGELLLPITDIDNLTPKDTLLTINEYATIDANSTIHLKPYGHMPLIFNKTINIITTGASILNRKHDYLHISNQYNLIKSIEDIVQIGSVLLKISNINIVKNNITANISRVDFLTSNPDVIYANQVLYLDIAKYKTPVIANSIAWKTNKSTSGQLLTNNLVINPINIINEYNIIEYSTITQDLLIRSTTIQPLNIFPANIKDPVMTVGVTVATDTNFIQDPSSKQIKFNSIYVDNINMNGRTDKYGFYYDNDGLLINGNYELYMLNASTMTFDYGVKIFAGENSTALNIVPYFIGNLVNNGVIGDAKTGSAIRIANFMAGVLENNNLIEAKNTAIKLTVSKYQQDRQFRLINNGKIIGDIDIEEKNTQVRYNVDIYNNCLIKASNIIATGKINVNVYNRKNAEIEVANWNISKIYNEGLLKLSAAKSYLDFTQLTNSGYIECKGDLQLYNHFINNGTISTSILFGKKSNYVLDNHGDIVATILDDITIAKNGKVLVKNNIKNTSVIQSTVTMLGNFTIDKYASITLGGLSGDKFNLTNYGKILADNIRVNSIINTKYAELSVAKNLSFYSDSTNYGSLKAGNISIINCKLTNQYDANLHITNTEKFTVEDNNFINLGNLTIDNVLYMPRKFTNNGSIIAQTFIADATEFIIMTNKSFSCKAIVSRSNLDIVNMGDFNIIENGIIYGTITVHADNNKNQDGIVVLDNNQVLNASEFTAGEIKVSNVNRECIVNIDKDSKLVVNKKINNLFSITSHGELVLCSGSQIEEYYGMPTASLTIGVDEDIVSLKYIDSLLKLSKQLFIDVKTSLFIKPNKRLTTGFITDFPLIMAAKGIYRSQDVILKTIKNDFITPLEDYGMMFYLLNFKIKNDDSIIAKLMKITKQFITADIYVLDTTKLTNYMHYADQILNYNDISSGKEEQELISNKDIVGVAIKMNFLTRNKKITSAKNLIISPVELFTDNIEVHFDYTKKSLSVGTTTTSATRTNIYATYDNPALVIGSSINPNKIFIAEDTGSVKISDINIDNINIYGATDSYVPKKDKPKFFDAVVLCGDHSIEVTATSGLTIGKNSIIKSFIKKGSALNISVPFIGNINNKGYIIGENSATAISMYNFTHATLTNKNIIYSNEKAIDLYQVSTAIQEDQSMLFDIVNDGTIAGGIRLYSSDNNEQNLAINIINNNYINSNNVDISGSVYAKIINNASAVFSIKNLIITDCTIDNKGILNIDEISNKNIINDTNFLNSGTAIIGSCVISATLTNNAYLYLKNYARLFSVNKTGIIYNNKNLVIDNIASDIEVINNDVFYLNQSCNSKAIISGTTTIGGVFTTLGNRELKLDELVLTPYAKIINGIGYTIKLQSPRGFTFNNNLENNGGFYIDNGPLILENDFINKGHLTAIKLLGNSKKIFIYPNKIAVFNNIGAVNDAITIFNKGTLMVVSPPSVTVNAKMLGDINIYESSTTNKTSDFKIIGNVDFAGGVLKASYFYSDVNHSVFTIAKGAKAIFDDAIGEQKSKTKIKIINKGSIEMAQGSKLMSYESDNADLYLSIKQSLTDPLEPLLLVNDQAIFSGDFKVAIKLPATRFPYRSISAMLDIIKTEKGIKKVIKNKVYDLTLADITNSLKTVQVNPKILYHLTDISIIDNKTIRAYIFAADISDLAPYMLPASHNLVIQSSDEIGDMGICWDFNKLHNKPSTNNLIISPLNLAIDDKTVNFSVTTRDLVIGDPTASSRENIFLFGAKAGIIIGTDIALDDYFTEHSESALHLNSVVLDNINLDSTRNNIDYSTVNDKTALLINGKNGLFLEKSPGITIATKTTIKAGNAAAAIKICARINGDIINYGTIGSHDTKTGILLSYIINGTLTNENTILAKQAIEYMEHQPNNDNITFNIVNNNSLQGDLLFAKNNNDTNKKIKLYNNKYIMANNIVSIHSADVSLYNAPQAEIVSEYINIPYLSNKGVIHINGNKIFMISADRFDNTGSVFANNVVLIADGINKGNLSAHTLQGTNDTLENIGDIQAVKLINININNKGTLKIFDSIAGNVSIKGGLDLDGDVEIQPHSKLSVDNINDTDVFLTNKGKLEVKADAHIKEFDNDIDGIIQVNGKLEFDIHSANSGAIITGSIVANNSRLSNYFGAVVRVTGKKGFTINKQNFSNSGELIVDYDLILNHDFVNSGVILANNLRGNNVNLIIDANKQIAVKNIDNANQRINIINNGKFIIGNSSGLSKLSGDIIVTNADKKIVAGDIIINNNIKQESGKLYAGNLTAINASEYTIESQAIAIFNKKINDDKLNVVNDGILNIAANSKLNDYTGNLGTLIITLDKKYVKDSLHESLLYLKGNAYLSKKSKIIINTPSVLIEKFQAITVNILDSVAGIIYNDLDYHKYDFSKLIFGVSTASVLLRIKDIVAESHSIQATILPRDVKDFDDNMGYTDTMLLKSLLGRCQIEDSIIEGISWNELSIEEQQEVNKNVLIAPPSIYKDKKAIDVKEDEINIGLLATKDASVTTEEALPGMVIDFNKEPVYFDKLRVHYALSLAAENNNVLFEKRRHTSSKTTKEKELKYKNRQTVVTSFSDDEGSESAEDIVETVSDDELSDEGFSSDELSDEDFSSDELSDEDFSSGDELLDEDLTSEEKMIGTIVEDDIGSQYIIEEDVAATKTVTSLVASATATQPKVTKNKKLKKTTKKPKIKHVYDALLYKNIKISKSIDGRKLQEQEKKQDKGKKKEKEKKKEKKKEQSIDADAVLIQGKPSSVVELTIDVEKNVSLIASSSSDALHLAIPMYAIITNDGTIGDGQTGCGLKITQPIAGNITNNGIIKGISAININTNHQVDQLKDVFTINNHGTITGVLYFNAINSKQKIKINNYNNIDSASITLFNKAYLAIENKKNAMLMTNYIAANKIDNYGTLMVNEKFNLQADNFVNVGFAEINDGLFVDKLFSNYGLLFANSITASNTAVVNNLYHGEIIVDTLDNININCDDTSSVQVNKSIINNVVVTGDIHINNKITINGNLIANRLLTYINEESKLVITKTSSSKFTQSFCNPMLDINNHGELTVCAGTDLRSYEALSGTLNIKIPYNYNYINRPLIIVEKTASFINDTGNMPTIYLYADIPPENSKLAHNFDIKQPFLVKILSARDLLYENQYLGNYINDILVMQAIASKSIFLKIENPYIITENDYKTIYAHIRWQEATDVLGIMKYPTSINKLTELMKKNTIIEQSKTIKQAVIDGVNDDYIQEEATEIIEYLLDDKRHLNIHRPLIQETISKLENILATDKNALAVAVKSLFPDTSSVDMHADTSLAKNAFSNIAQHLLNTRIHGVTNTAFNGVNSGTQYNTQPMWYSVCFNKTKQDLEQKFISNQWVANLFNIGVDQKLTDSFIFGITASYAKTTISPINNNYVNFSHNITSVFAALYLQYVTNFLCNSLSVLIGNNYHHRNSNYNIINKNYKYSYTSRISGAMLEMSYPYNYDIFKIELTGALKVFKDFIPNYSIDIYEKYYAINFYNASFNTGIHASFYTPLYDSITLTCATSVVYAYNFILGNRFITTNYLGKKFNIRHSNRRSSEFNVNFNIGVNLADRINITSYINYTKLSYMSTIGLMLSFRYLF